MKRLSIVALIGQTNAGKSSLLNRFAHKNIAIVAREEGTTRDNVIANIDNKFLLIDTAGLKDPEDDFEQGIQDQIADAIDSADIILVTLDSTKYFDHHDKNIAKSALRSKKPVFLLLNKSDRGEALDTSEFRALAIPEDRIFRTSATTAQGIRELKRAILKELGELEGSFSPEFEALASSETWASRAVGVGCPHPSTPRLGHKGEKKPSNSPTPLKIALIGRPNVGKSSLFNSLAKKQQALVSSRQGTTRDVNRVSVKYNGRTLEILDTAGLRRPGKREVGIEKFSAIRTLAAIEEADICALLIDATEPHSKLDQSLAGQIIDAGKGIIVVVTKTDLLYNVASKLSGAKTNLSEEGEASNTFLKPDGARQRESERGSPVATTQANERTRSSLLVPSRAVASLKKTGRADASQESIVASPSPTDRLLNDLERDFNFLPFAPVLLTSSETGKNVTKLFDLAEQIDKARHHEIKTADLNKILKDAISSHPPAGLKNTRPKPKYIVQTDTNPPWFVIHGHELQLMHWSYKRFLERKIREFYPYLGTPIFFSFRSDKNLKETLKT